MQEHLTRLRRATALCVALWLVFVVVSCGRADKSSAASDDKSAQASASGDGTDSNGYVRIAKSTENRDSLGMMADVPGLTPGGECPPAGPSAAEEMAAQAAARIPLKVGLTLSHVWKMAAGDYEHECLLQVTTVDVRGVDVTSSCPIGPDRKLTTSSRRICRSDLANSYIYVTEFDTGWPPTLRGSLQFSLSESSFAALKTRGHVRHRYLNVPERTDRLLVLDKDVDGDLKSEGKSTFKVIVNDTAVELSTIEATLAKDNHLIRVKVLDEPHVPIMLDYYHPADKFFVTYTKISFPTEHTIEQHLATDRKVDVYGIYFDFASDSLRKESYPVLREIATALDAHPEWKLTITGHTDSIGGAASNLELSRKRSARVRRALVEQFHIADARLTTSGSGAGQPKDVNTTVEGRARNRRVELVRQ
ncbi:MAG TPA: OmpA family protein [Gemmatimonadaceae bacterium]|nr:OmpA family protein [Gemmatimonadaceae bacterium]